MADFYVDANGNISKKKKKNQPSYRVDLEGNVAKLETEIDEELAPVKRNSYLEEALSAPDFAVYSQKGASLVNPTWEEATKGISFAGWRPFAEKVANPVTFLRENVDTARLYGDELLDKWDSDMAFMTDEEVGVYNYYLAKYGKKKASEYLDSIEDDLAKREGGFFAKNIEGNSFAEVLVAGGAGLESAKQGLTTNMKNLITGSEEVTKPTAMMYADQALAQNNTGALMVARDVAYGAGNMVPSLVVGAFNPFAGAATMGAGVAGNKYNEMIERGYDVDEARLVGVGVGVAEGAFQYLMGGIGKLGGKAGGKILSKVAPGVTSKITGTVMNVASKTPAIAQAFGRAALEMGKEGAEEALQTYLEPLIESWVTKEAYDAPDFEEVVYSALIGSLTSFGLEGAPGIARATVDTVTGKNTAAKGPSTDTEKAVVEKEVADRIAQEEADGKTLTVREKAAIEKQVYEDLEKGRISTDTIESVLGGDTYKAFEEGVRGFDESETYKAYQEAVAEEKAIREEFETLQNMKAGEATIGQQDRYNELKARIAEFETKSKSKELRAQLEPEIQRINALKKQLQAEVSGKVQSDRLAESYRELQRSTEKFQADPTKYKNEHARKTIQNLIDGGIANNTREFHEFADMLAKWSEDKGIEFDAIDNKKLAGTQFAVQGATVNAYVTEDGKITFNVDSRKRLNSLAGHEITHVLEGTAFYDTLAKAVKEYATKKGEWDSRLASVTELYKKYNPKADPVKELTADLVGDYIFTDKAFLETLSVRHRNIFQKIYDEIKYMVKTATAGSEEARLLLKAEKAFADAYRASGKVQAKAKRENLSTPIGEQAPINTPEANSGTVSSADSIAENSEKSSSEAINLSPEQEEFFKDSVVRDENGKLKVMYHGTSKGGHTVFDPYGKARYGLFGLGTYFTDSKEIAESYTKKGKGTNPEVYETYLNIKNPMDMDGPANPAEWAEAFPDAHFPESGTNEDFYRAMEEYFEDMEYVRWEAEEAAMDAIMGMGYDGITHIGGGRVNAEGPRHQVYIAFEPEQIKRTDNVKPTGDPDIRYSITEQETQESNRKLNEVGLEYDRQSKTVSYSISSLEDAFDVKKDLFGNPTYGEDYIRARDEYVIALAKTIAAEKGKPTQEEIEKANRYLDSLFLIHDMIASDRDRLDYEAAVGKSAWVSNAEYGGSIDFSTLCAKRRLFTGTFDAIQNALPDTVLNENDFLQIRDMLLKKELESPCSMCYVEGSRARHGVYVEKWLKEYLKTNPEWKPQIADFTSTTRLEQTRIQHPEAYAAYQKAMNSLAQRKPKEATVRTDYKGEILVAFSDGSSVEIKNQNGGIRFNSFSDFEIIHALDAMQVITDMARVGLNGQAYTKVKEFAEAFGNTGLKINLSLVAKDVDENGRLVFDEINGMNYAEAMDIRSRYSDNVGSVLVVFNDAQLKAALADSTIDYVLPFHRSQWKKSQYTMMGLPTQTKDYTMVQNDRITNPKTGKPVKLSKLKRTTTYTNDVTGQTYEIRDNIMPNQYWDFNKSGRENAQRYLDYINANGMTPKFDSVLEKVDGKWVLPDGPVGDGYFKLLIDFKMYNNDGWGSPQMPVLPEFNMPYIQNMLKNYTGGHQAFPVAHDVVEEFVAGKKKGAFSLSRDGEAPVRGDGYAVYGENVRVGDPAAFDFAPLPPMQEDIAPAREDVQKPVADTVDMDGYAPISAEEAGQRDDGIAFPGDADAPPEREAPYYGEDVEDLEPADPFENRDIDAVGKRNVKAYMYENPEVKPFFQAEANVMLGELNRTTKGEKQFLYGDFDGYGAESYYRVVGTTRHTSDDIAYLRDTLNYSYADIEKGLKAIIEDDGKENNAISKRIEFLLNDRLLNGYRDMDSGYEYPPNQRYVNLLNEKQITEYNEEARARFFDTADAYVPPVEDVAPVAEHVSYDIAPVREEYEAITPEKQKYGGKMVRVDTHQGKQQKLSPEFEKVAEVLDAEPETVPRKARAWARFKANFLDKGAVFEDLALKKKNRELMGKWNYMLYSEARAQRLMGNGTNGVKSMNAIIEEVGDKAKTFYEYLYHVHNIDRMTLADRFEGMENKPVFGDSVTADVSREAVKRYEAENPMFKQYAEDVYAYNVHLRDLLVDNGVISPTVADLWAEMYPHYVPIRRAGDHGLNVNVPLDTGRTGVNAPVKRATGGNSDILPLFDTMAQRTVQTYRAISKNSFGVELKNTLGTTISNEQTSVDEVIDTIDAQDGLLQEGKNGRNPTFTVFEGGQKVTYEITEDMYDALKPMSEGMAYTNKALNTASNFHRGLLTEYNPVFMITNAVKDVQDLLINSQHAMKTYAKIPEAFAQLVRKGYWYNEYMEAGGDQNTYFDNETNTFKTENKGIAKILDIPPLSTISKLNNFIEMTPRLAEYIASREAGRSVEVSMLDAARVTTNFRAGGDVTKFLNRNGATFLNASVQGAMQQVRNVREAKANGMKGWANLATKFIAAGLPALILNHLIWDDDEEYEELADYVKQNYYIVAKTGDGKFIRIPKGRTLAVIQDAMEQVSNALTGDDEADLKSFLELVVTNLSPNNPIENNILAPIIQVANNETWYGEDLVPQRLADLPAAEQFDESTDAFSKWLGGKLNVSPVKINYLLDQYSGGAGDVVLPMMTPEAESGDNSLVGNLLAPLKSKFTADSVMNNQNVSDFYDTKDELATEAKKSAATDTDIIQSKYMNSINAQLSKLYAEKREIQNSDLSDDVKYDMVSRVQNQIVDLTREALEAHEDVTFSDGHAMVGGLYFKKNEDGEWQKLSDDQVTKYEITSAAGNSSYATDGSVHFRWYQKEGNAEGEWRKITDKELEKQNEVTSALGISASDYWSNKDEYDYAYEYPENYAVAKAVGGYDAFKAYSSELGDIPADKDADGKSISGSRKAKVVQYINGLNADYGEKLILFKSEYNGDDTYNYEIVDYLNSRDDISYEDMVVILKKLGFTVSADGDISW